MQCRNPKKCNNQQKNSDVIPHASRKKRIKTAYICWKYSSKFSSATLVQSNP